MSQFRFRLQFLVKHANQLRSCFRLSKQKLALEKHGDRLPGHRLSPNQSQLLLVVKYEPRQWHGQM
jgi:hypothetical protein